MDNVTEDTSMQLYEDFVELRYRITSDIEEFNSTVNDFNSYIKRLQEKKRFFKNINLVNPIDNTFQTPPREPVNLEE